MKLSYLKSIFSTLSNKYFNTFNTVKFSDIEARPCLTPFIYAEISRNGLIFPCCPSFLKFELNQNIKSNKFTEIWNGKLLTDLRKRILKGDFSKCNRTLCCSYRPCSINDIPADYKKGPKELKIAYDLECNYNCITCRDDIKINSPKDMEIFENIYLPQVIEIAQNAKYISLLGSGEPLFSRHSRHLIKELVKNYPELRFKLFTNGYLLNEENLIELGIQNNIEHVSVSVDTVNRETYLKIFRKDAFDIIMKNLEFISEWKKQGKINLLMLNFVVHLMNYKEMPDFVKLAQHLDAIAFFSTYVPWHSAEYDKQYDKVAVFEPQNKHFKELTQILKNPIFNDKKHCMLEPKLQAIADL